VRKGEGAATLRAGREPYRGVAAVERRLGPKDGQHDDGLQQATHPPGQVVTTYRGFSALTVTGSPPESVGQREGFNISARS
jgi:hypothetical protein